MAALAAFLVLASLTSPVQGALTQDGTVLEGDYDFGALCEVPTRANIDVAGNAGVRAAVVISNGAIEALARS
ncbi:MAG: hypothetical protein LC623_06365, partial [Halobacteriales archaeon]|nr:hypothetical protein [Halobacteriales archaeon]